MNMTPEEYVVGRMPSRDETRMIQLTPLAVEDIGENWGDCRDKAIALLLLHWLALENQVGASKEDPGSILPGIVSDIKEGDLSVSREIPNSSDSSFRVSELPWSTTIYGQELIALKKGCFILPRNRLV